MNPQSASVTFADDTAEKTGVSSRVIHKEIQISEHLDEQATENRQKVQNYPGALRL